MCAMIPYRLLAFGAILCVWSYRRVLCLMQRAISYLCVHIGRNITADIAYSLLYISMTYTFSPNFTVSSES